MSAKAACTPLDDFWCPLTASGPDWAYKLVTVKKKRVFDRAMSLPVAQRRAQSAVWSRHTVVGIVSGGVLVERVRR